MAIHTDVLAYFDHLHTSNGPTVAINGRLEHLHGTALGFRNLNPYTTRSLIHAGGFKKFCTLKREVPLKIDEVTLVRARAVAGLKGYVTNIDATRMNVLEVNRCLPPAVAR